MRKHSFELNVIPLDDGGYRLELWEPAAPDTKPSKRRTGATLSSMEGWPLQLADALLRRSLENNGYSASDITRTRRTPLRLKEEDGIRLDLAFRSVKNVKQRSRIEDILHGIMEMSREEALYWHSKVTITNGTTTQNGLSAMRVLLAGWGR